ncbi:putative G-protein coupled receptor 144 [Tupaia chinensis]|uniref:Putative G-protein coupled receptor 144 n=1 Tax=Tupaia chinensis TaxID=246437 RepID=L9JD98_TUPCH|nr:putative G-protein coupled receptor 144 [Tupaia chinensis]
MREGAHLSQPPPVLFFLRSQVSLGPPPIPQVSYGTLGPQDPPMAPGEVVETADGVCVFPGQTLSWWQAQGSCAQRFGHLALGPTDGVLAPRMPGPFWVSQGEASLQRPPQRPRDAFSGNLTDFHLWARALSPAQLHRARACAPPPSGLLFRWDPSALDVTPSLLPAVRVRFLCPVPSEECPVWNPGPSTEGSQLCLQKRPFFCCYQTETYRRLQDAQSWPGQDVISRVNALANATVLHPDPLSGAHGALSLVEASSFLGILERVLAEEAAPLGPAALLAVVQFLRRVTALEAGEPEPEPLTGLWEQLGRGVTSVASLILEEWLAGTWLSIHEVVGGPMALVASVHHLAPLLGTMLTSERPRMHFQHRHVGLEVRSLHLREAGMGGSTFTVPGGRPDGPGHIHIPAGEVRRLLGTGLSGVTVIHSWFASSVLQHTLGGLGPEPQALDGGSEETSSTQRLLSTQLGSAIISSEAWDVAGAVSTAVSFHLQHQAIPQKLTEPVCAFWNFSKSPDAGGSWATTGCSVVALHHDSAACFCNHSTNFAVLLQVYDVQRGPEEESLLKTLSFVGCGVSFCALATTFLLLLVAGVPKSQRTTVHKNLSFALASAEGFLMASEWAKTNKVACVAVTAVMHFLFLAAFSWMLVEGLLLWSKVVAVSMRPGPRTGLVYAAGWGTPMVIVALTLAAAPHDYVAPGHCWLSVHTDTIWAFVGPVLLVLTANTCILVRVVVVTVSSAHRRARVLSPRPCLQQQIKLQIWATVKPVLVLLPVLGLTWLVGILVHLSPAWAYAAVGLNSFQGPYIFLVYAASNGEIQASPARRGPGPRAPGSQEEAPDSPVALAAPRRHMALRGAPSQPTSGRSPVPQCPRPGEPITPSERSLGPWSLCPPGTHGPRIPSAFSSIAELQCPKVLPEPECQGHRQRWGDKVARAQSRGTPGGPGLTPLYLQAVELTAFKASGAAPLQEQSAPAPAPRRSSDSAFVSAESGECARAFPPQLSSARTAPRNPGPERSSTWNPGGERSGSTASRLPGLPRPRPARGSADLPVRGGPVPVLYRVCE